MSELNPLERLIGNYLDSVVDHYYSYGPGEVARDLIDVIAKDNVARAFITDPNAWDPDHDQDAKCASCGHAYDRHYDWMTFDDDDPPMIHVGCKYDDCYNFKEPDANTPTTS